MRITPPPPASWPVNPEACARANPEGCRARRAEPSARGAKGSGAPERSEQLLQPDNELPQTLAYFILSKLRWRIISGDLQPGQPLREMEIQSHYGSSRGPVRESLRLLHQNGLVEHQQRARVPGCASIPRTTSATSTPCAGRSRGCGKRPRGARSHHPRTGPRRAPPAHGGLLQEQGHRRVFPGEQRVPPSHHRLHREQADIARSCTTSTRSPCRCATA